VQEKSDRKKNGEKKKGGIEMVRLKDTRSLRGSSPRTSKGDEFGGGEKWGGRNKVSLRL